MNANIAFRSACALAVLAVLSNASAASPAAQVGATAAAASESGLDTTTEFSAGQRFEMRAEQSRFDVGAGAHDQADGPYRRRIGERGVFFVDTVTGSTLGVLSSPETPKGAVPSRGLPQPLSTDPEVHHAAAVRYLLGAGVPAAEVSGRHVTATMGGGGAVEDGVRPQTSTLLWYTTHLERSLAGIPVEGSFAFAALDSEGKSITEGVYWPEIPADVVRRAVMLRRRLDNADGLRGYQALLRGTRPDLGQAIEGEVRIVHTTAGFHGPFEAQAVYSVIQRKEGGGKAQILRFDADGGAVRLADEARSGRDSVKLR